MKKEIELQYNWKYSDKWPYNGMVNDLYRGIQAEENYLVALGLFTYSETMGWIISSNKKKNAEAYRLFTEQYVGYTTFDDLEDVYKNARNGLAHRYFIKNRFGNIFNDEVMQPVGIIVTDTNIDVYINTYFRDFVKGLTKYLDELC